MLPSHARMLRRNTSLVKDASLPAKIFWVLVGIGVVLLTLHLAFQYLNLSHNEKHGQIFEISNRFDVDDEASIPTWFSQAVWMGIAGASVLAVRLNKDKLPRRLWLIMAFAGIFFSIDEVSGIHELSLQSLHLLFFGLEQSSSSLNAWWLVLPLILLFGAWFLRKLYGILRFRQWLTMMVGGAVFLTGAVGFELYGNDIPHNNFYYQGIITGLEEGLEMLGGIIILYVILKYLDTFYGTYIKQVWQQLDKQKS
jgi:hypothetical protein